VKIQVAPGLWIDDEELLFRAARASGPGGQHVNKTSTAIELRFDVRGSASLSEDVRDRLERLAGTRLTQDGVLILFSQGHRSQELNRQDAVRRLLALIRQAGIRPRLRRATKPTYASKLRRLEGKTRRSGVKLLRGKPGKD
jgi:ribosome-associated protein